MKKEVITCIVMIFALVASVNAQTTFEKIFRVNNQSTEVNAVFPVADGFVMLTTHGPGILNLTKLNLKGEFVSGRDIYNVKSGFVMSSFMTSSGNILITGVATDDENDESAIQKGFFIKASSNLTVQAAIEFKPFAGNGDCWASGAIQTSDGSILVLAKSTVTSVGGIDNYFEIMKMNSSVTKVEWASAILAGNENTVFDIAETGAGYEIYGAVKNKNTGWNLYLGTISTDGKTMYRQLIVGGSEWDGALDIQEDAKKKVRNLASRIALSGNSLTVAAYTKSYGSNPEAGDEEGNSIFLLNLPVSGNSYNWSALVDGKNHEKIFGPFGGGNLISLQNGDLLLSGFTSSTGKNTPYPGGFMYRFEAKSNGTITPRWQHVFTPPNNLTPMGLAEATDGTLLLAGGSAGNSKQGIVIRTTADGISPAGCISANYANLEFKSITPSVLSTTNAALLRATLNMFNVETISGSTTITTICSANSETKINPPVIGAEPQSQTIAKGQSAHLTVQSTGSAPIHYQWFEGESGDESKPTGTDSVSFTTPALNSSSKFWVKISNANGVINSATAIIDVEDIKWFQADWGDYKQKPYQLLLTKENTVLVLTQDVITRFGPNDWPCGSPPGKLYAVNPQTGAVIWKIDLGHSASPAVDKDGSIFTNIENRFYRVNPANGQMALVYTASRNFTSPPAISAAGFAYIGAGQKVLAIDLKTGKLEWEEPVDKFVIHHPSIASDGTVYVIPWRLSSRMYAFYPRTTTKQVKWIREINGFFTTAPAIGLDGVIYAGSGSKLYALHPQNGADKWIFTTPIAPAGYPTIQNITSEPVIGKNGTIYLSALTSGDDGGAIFAIHPEGYPKWFFSSGLTIYTSPVLAKDETIYYPADNLYVLDKYGKEIGSKEVAGSMSPVLAPDGSTYFGSWEHNGVTAISSTHGGLATAHWPAFAHDFQHSGQHDDSFVGIPPTITVQPENLMIKSGQKAKFSVSVSGAPTIKYQWYEGVAGDKTKPVGTDSVYTTPALTKMTNYWVEVENEFGKDASTTVMASTGNVGEVKWFYLTNPTFSKKEDGEIMGGVALAKDGTLYFPVHDGRLFAMNPDKTLKWIANIQAYTDEEEIINAVSTSTPTIGTDGTIYVNTLGYYMKNYSDQYDFGILWAINPDGSEKWRYVAGHLSTKDKNVTDTWLRGSAAIGHDGTIYIATEGGTLHAVKPDGTLKWKFNAAAKKSWYRGLEGGPPAVGTDGTVYYVAGGEFKLNDISSMETRILAINPDGSYKWDFLLIEDKVFFSENSPAIGPDGRIYVDNNNGSSVSYLFALNPDGTKAWEFHTGQNTGSSAVIAKDGTIYISGSSYVSSAHRIKIYALNPDGTEKWRFPQVGAPDKFGFAISTPVIGADNNIYYGTITANVGGSDGRLYALKPDGTALWSNPPNLGNTVESPPVIAPDGTLYAGRNGGGSESDYSGILYAVNTTAFGVANTAWPMDGQNPQRVQRAVGFPQCTEPVIMLQPADTTIVSDEAVKLTVNATGTELSFQWFEGADRSKPVGTGASFVTPDLDKTTSYWVKVSNSCGTVNSRMAKVTVNSPVGVQKFSSLADIKINDQSIKGFVSTTFEYEIVLPAGTIRIPPISAFSAVIGAEVKITAASSVPGTAMIDVVSPDGVTKQTYTLRFTLSTSVSGIETGGGFKIYPNPVSDKLKLVLPSSVSTCELRINSVNGQLVFFDKTFSGNEVDVSALVSGVYFISLKDRNNSFFGKFVKTESR
jgi:outer membrane protein assembly factor BamB